jgi:hypothetical protein
MFPLPARINILLAILGLSRGKVFLHRKVALELYKNNGTSLIGPLVNVMVIDLAETQSWNVKASTKCVQRFRISSVSFFLDHALIRTDNIAPFWMFGDKDGVWTTPTIGSHTITAKAYRRNNGKGRLMLETTIGVMVIDGRRT